MVVEHSFVTRLGPDETMRTALNYLREHWQKRYGLARVG